VKRTQGILQAIGMTVHPEVLIQLRENMTRTSRVLTFTEDNTRPSVTAWMERSVGVIRPWHARREVSGNPGGPHGSSYDIPLLRHTRGNPDTELSGSLRTMRKAEKYGRTERLPHIMGESYQA
jgi:hypothetical protein